ncbi:hypothetical protein N9D31_02070 [Oligoflexaceae bacterium]|nr:hypothetical protein [Oligoflexaceae bacterium]
MTDLLVLLLYLFLIPSCISTPKIEINESKVLGYRFDLEDRKKMELPYVAKFTVGEKELLYLLSKHVSQKDYPRVIDHPTLVTIRRLFKKFKPQVVIVEGIPSGDELSPKNFLGHTQKCRSRKFSGCGESFFAIDQAVQNGGEFISGEPSEEYIQHFLAKSGFSKTDILGFYMVRQIPQMKRHDEFSKKDFPKECERVLSHYRKRLGMVAAFSCDDFKKWYEAHMKKPKNFLDIDNNDSAPHGGKDATYVQRISHQVGIARDRTIVKRIETMMNQFDRVLIVYGGSHYLLQEKSLTGALGKPAFFKAVKN